MNKKELLQEAWAAYKENNPFGPSRDFVAGFYSALEFRLEIEKCENLQRVDRAFEASL